MLKRFLFILIFFTVAISSSAVEEDIVSLQKKDNERQTLEQNFLKRMFWNPAIQLYRFDNSLSKVYVQGKGDSKYELPFIEQGDAQLGIQAGANTYVSLNKHSRIWGEAYYKRGVRRNVLWNETSDFELVYPYVTADSLGGDLTHETYYFKGGYVHQLKRWTIGAEFHYRAMLEFRKIDPRPRNSIAELEGIIGASVALSPSYALSISVGGQKYKQTDNIVYFNELGVSKTFQLTGLGSSYVRFDGSNTSVFYDGVKCKTGIDLLPISSKGGFMLSAYYKYLEIDKILLNKNNLLLNGVKDHGFEGHFGWLSPLTSSRWGIRAVAEYRQRDGKMILYDDGSNNEYKVVLEKVGFKLNELNAYLHGFWEMRSQSEWYCGADLRAGYVSREERNLDTKNRMEYSLMDIQLRFNTGWNWRKDALRLNLAGGYMPNLESRLKINKIKEQFSENILKSNFEYFKSDKAHYRLGLNWSHEFNKVQLALGTQWGQLFTSCGRDGYIWTANIEIAF